MLLRASEVPWCAFKPIYSSIIRRTAGPLHRCRCRVQPEDKLPTASTASGVPGGHAASGGGAIDCCAYTADSLRTQGPPLRINAARQGRSILADRRWRGRGGGETAARHAPAAQSPCHASAVGPRTCETPES
jgi:hypothetical protein